MQCTYYCYDTNVIGPFEKHVKKSHIARVFDFKLYNSEPNQFILIAGDWLCFPDIQGWVDLDTQISIDNDNDICDPHKH